MAIADTLLPVLLLIAVGRALASWRFLGATFSTDVNKLVFWVALPCLLFRSAAAAGMPSMAVARLLGVLLLATLWGCLAAFAFARWSPVPSSQVGSCIQAAFRGNLAYVGIPVLTYAAVTPATAALLPDLVVVMTLTMVVYNALAVWVLSHGRHGWSETLRGIGTNPLLIAGLAGVAWGALALPLPVALDRGLQAMGSASVPLALLCIGGSLSLGGTQGRWPALTICLTVKLVLLPVTTAVLAAGFGLSGFERTAVVLLSACPTAAASYVMAVKSGGDGALTSTAISLSTVLAFPVLAGILWIFPP